MLLHRLLLPGYTIQFILLAALPKGGACSESQDRLLETLFNTQKYNRLSRPVEKNSDTVDVRIGLVLRQIVQVDERNERLIASIWKRMYWQDYRLKWNVSQYDGLKTISIPPSTLWIPDIVLYNSVDENLAYVKDAFNVLVTSDGFCLYYPLEIVSAYCAIDISRFPFDDQFCTLEYESWGHEMALLNVSLTSHGPSEGADLTWLKKNTEWIVLESPGVRNETMYPCCNSPFAVIVFTIHLRRKILFYAFNLILPCAVISALSSLAFLLPSASERVGLGLTTLLALSVYQIIIIDKIPASSDGIPLIGMYFMSQIGGNAVAVVVMVATAGVHQISEEKPVLQMPRMVRKFIYGYLARLLRFKPPLQEPANSSKDQARTAFNALTTLVADADYSEAGVGDRLNDGGNPFSNGAHDMEVMTSTVPQSRARSEPSLDEKEKGLRKDEGQCGKILKDGELKTTAEDWKFVGTVVDRLCFCIYGLFQIFLLVFIMSYAIK